MVPYGSREESVENHVENKSVHAATRETLHIYF